MKVPNHLPWSRRGHLLSSQPATVLLLFVPGTGHFGGGSTDSWYKNDFGRSANWSWSTTICSSSHIPACHRPSIICTKTRPLWGRKHGLLVPDWLWESSELVLVHQHHLAVPDSCLPPQTACYDLYQEPGPSSSSSLLSLQVLEGPWTLS